MVSMRSILAYEHRTRWVGAPIAEQAYDTLFQHRPLERQNFVIARAAALQRRESIPRIRSRRVHEVCTAEQPDDTRLTDAVVLIN